MLQCGIFEHEFAILEHEDGIFEHKFAKVEA